MYSLTATVGNYARLYQKLHKTIQPYVFLAAELNGAIGIMTSKKTVTRKRLIIYTGFVQLYQIKIQGLFKDKL